MAFIDYYKILGLEKTASLDDIKKAYRKLARKYHPDMNPNDTEANKKFQQINEANEVLGDPEKRKKYDEYGEHWKNADQYEQAKQSQRSQGGYSGGSNYSGGFADDDFSDFFSSMFGNREGRGRSVKYRGQDYTAEIRLGLKDALLTHHQTINVNGKTLRITVPAGIANGQVIKLKGHGGPGTNNGPDGDLYITFVIADDPVFKRVGDDIFMNVDLDIYKAVLGGELTIDTLNGKVKLKVKPETQNATKVRLKGKGFPVYKKEGQAGDLFITYSVKVPTGLTEKQKQLFEELSKLST